MEATGMEVEEDSAPISSNHMLKRFGLKNSIQTNFGEDYVFQIAARDDSTLMAVSLSSNTIKLYSPETGQYFGECRGHSRTINNIAFSAPSFPHVLHSCSSDGSLRAWDTRTYNQVSYVHAGPSQEIYSFSFGGSGDSLLAAGCKSQILFWDWRNKKQAACLEESHVDDVTQVSFVPGYPNKLLSASVDGLMCFFNTDGDINDDEHLESVINVGTSIGRVGFFGDTSQNLWCLTHIETLSVWDWQDARIEANFEDSRGLASEMWMLDDIDYFVDCHYSLENDKLWVIGGTNSGTLGYFPVNYKGGKGAIGSAEAVLEGGHKGVVRSVLPMRKRRGIFGWTGGEDGSLCCWSSDESSEGSGSSWTSSTLVMKSMKSCKRIRHHPYQ